MKIIKPLLIATSLCLSQASFADDNKYQEGEKLFKTYCAACHGANVGGMDMNKRIAPPIAAVRLHYIGTHTDEASFVQAVTSWVGKQDASKSLMRGAINKFRIMPPIVVPKEDAIKIAQYIYAGKIEEPEGFKQHVENMHGKGMGMDKGDMHKKGMHQQKHGDSEMHQKNKGMMGGMMSKLNLSPEQKQKIRPLMHEIKAILSPEQWVKFKQL